MSVLALGPPPIFKAYLDVENNFYFDWHVWYSWVSVVH